MPIPVPALSKAWVCGRWLAGIAGSNSAGGMNVCLFRVLCEVFATGLSLIQRSPTKCGVSECDRGTSIMTVLDCKRLNIRVIPDGLILRQHQYYPYAGPDLEAICGANA
jgi:hypothetical protein